MSDMTDIDPTNAQTAKHATQTVSLPKGRVHVIGIAGSADMLHALLRTENDEIQTVNVGDAVGKGTVIAIDAEKVIVSVGKRNVVLHMPT